ncbi:MAG: type II secretion system secretin GspD, partial [Pseudobdellovibrionaceae bacterium]|nr:type II secretion system secretin GspD [Pseudobdellovibrionaceae bacterium]
FDEMEFSDFPGAITPPGASSGNSPSFNTINSEQNFSNPSRGGSFPSLPRSDNTRSQSGGLGRDGKNANGGSGDGNSVLSKEKRQKLSEAELEEISDDAYPEMIDSFDFPNAEIKDVVKAISELTGKNFIIDPGVGGKITIIAPSRITVAEAYKAFLSALAVNGLAVVPSGKFLKIRMARNAQRDGIETYTGSYYPNFDQLITRVIGLKHISAEVVHRELKTLTSKDGEMTVHTPTNSIIISDYGSNIDRLMKVIAQLDVPGFEDQLAVIPIKYAKAKDIADLVNKIVNKGEGQRQGVGGAFSSGLPRFGRTGGDSRGQGSPYFMVIPDDRSNSLVVVGNKAGIERVKSLLKQLDFPIRPEDSGGVYVYYVKYGDAEKIAQTLGVIAKEAAPTQGQGNTQVVVSPTAGVQVPTQAIFGGNIKINADKNTNSLVILASKQDYELILNLLKRLDIPRDQVYVESIIMEMKANDSLDWQIGYFKFDESGSGAKAGFNGMKPETLGAILGTPSGGNGAILGFGSKDVITVTPPVPGAQPYKIASLVGFINFLKTYSNANVLSTPQLLVMDNQEGEISVGDRVVTAQNVVIPQQGGPAQSNIQFEDVTISLKIKPFISPSINSVRLELQSQVNQLSTAKTPPGLVNVAQPIATRKIKTNIVVPNKDTAVLGGLIKEDDIETVQKVPLLGDIPIIGWLFRSRGVSKEKTNLLVFLTPHIIRTESDSRNMLGRKLNERLNFIKSMGGRDPFGKKVDEISASQAEASVQEVTRDAEQPLAPSHPKPSEPPLFEEGSGEQKPADQNQGD